MATNLSTNIQSLAVDDFFYFFLRLRKQRIRGVVNSIRTRFPGESREQLAQRLIASHASLSLIGGALFHVPALLPGIAQVWKVLGLVGGASALTRMHLYLILEIALLYGKDIDDQARVPEMVSVVAATAAAVGAPAVAVRLFDVSPLIAIPVAGLTATAVTRLIGKTAIRHYAGEAPVLLPTPEAGTSPAPASA